STFCTAGFCTEEVFCVCAGALDEEKACIDRFTANATVALTKRMLMQSAITKTMTVQNQTTFNDPDLLSFTSLPPTLHAALCFKSARASLALSLSQNTCQTAAVT